MKFPLKNSLLAGLILIVTLMLAACNPTLDTATPETSPTEQNIGALDPEVFAKNKKLIDYFIENAPYLALVKTDHIKRRSIWADEISQMQDLEYQLTVLETFRGEAADTITYLWSIEMEPLGTIPEIDFAPHIISLCHANGEYRAQDVGFAIEAHPKLIKYAREAANKDPASGRMYTACPPSLQE